MSANPKRIEEDAMAVDAMEVMETMVFLNY